MLSEATASGTSQPGGGVSSKDCPVSFRRLHASSWVRGSVLTPVTVPWDCPSPAGMEPPTSHQLTNARLVLSGHCPLNALVPGLGSSPVPRGPGPGLCREALPPRLTSGSVPLPQGRTSQPHGPWVPVPMLYREAGPTVVAVVTAEPRSRAWWMETGFGQGLFADDAPDPGASQSGGKRPRHKGPGGAALPVDTAVGAPRASAPSSGEWAR